MTPPIGTAPLVMPLTQVIRSGVTPSALAAKAAPARPKPVTGSTNHGRDRRGVVQGQQLLEFVCEMRAPWRLAARVGRAVEVMGVPEMIDLRQQRTKSRRCHDRRETYRPPQPCHDRPWRA